MFDVRISIICCSLRATNDTYSNIKHIIRYVLLNFELMTINGIKLTI